MQNIYKILSNINQIIINPIIGLMFGIALIYFLYGVLEYLWKSRSDPAKIKQGTSHMLWGIFGMFIMISVFGLFKFLINTVPTSDTSKQNVNRVMNVN
jgi:ABC-type thiamin/hydroxymethylpyrimidine transport system permease subunit